MLVGMIAALVLTVLGAVFDVYTTKRALADNPRKFKEGNPIMRLAMKLGGIWFLAAIKVGFCAFIFWVVLAWQTWPTNLAGMFCGLLWLFAGWRNRKLLVRAGLVLLASGFAMAQDAPKPAPVDFKVPPLAVEQKGQLLGVATLMAGNSTSLGIGAGAGYRFPTGIIYMAQLTWQEFDGASGTSTYDPPGRFPPVQVPYAVPTRQTWGLAVTLAFPLK